MLQPATLRYWGSWIGYAGVALVLVWIARLIWLGSGGWPTGGLVDTLLLVHPTMWLFVPLAGLPGFLIHQAGDAIEAQREGLSIREVQFRRKLRFRSGPSIRKVHPGQDRR